MAAALETTAIREAVNQKAVIHQSLSPRCRSLTRQKRHAQRQARLTQPTSPKRPFLDRSTRSPGRGGWGSETGAISRRWPNLGGWETCADRGGCGVDFNKSTAGSRCCGSVGPAFFSVWVPFSLGEDEMGGQGRLRLSYLPSRSQEECLGFAGSFK